MFDLDAEVADFVARVRRAWIRGNTVTSWWRDPISNEEAGGEPDSQHLVGLAVDVDGPFLQLFRDRCDAEGLVTVREHDHLHVQRYPKGALAEAMEEVGAGIAGGPLQASQKVLRDANVGLNQVLGGLPGETISARIGARIREGTATFPERALCDLLDVVDPEHCERAAELFEEGGDDDLEEDAPVRHRHRRHRVRREDPCLEEPWWLRCPDPDPDEDD